MDDDSPELGKRFSQIYITRPELLPDSVRMRRRVGHKVFGAWQESGILLANLLNSELGTNLTLLNAQYEFYWPENFAHLQLRDVLDAITVVALRHPPKSQFIHDIRRIFSEECVRYAIDDLGGVHLKVDSAFEQNRVAAVASLSSSRYQGVRELLEEGYKSIDAIPPDGKMAMRNVFFAAEGLFRLMFPKAHQLSTSELSKHLKPLLDQHYAGQRPANHAAQKQLAQLSDWVDGAHFYRHEPGTEEPSQPPFEMAVNYVSVGTSWIRWLRSFDA